MKMLAGRTEMLAGIIFYLSKLTKMLAGEVKCGLLGKKCAHRIINVNKRNPYKNQKDFFSQKSYIVQ